MSEEDAETIERLETELETYREQRQIDVGEITMLRNDLERTADWQSKTLGQIERVIAAWDNEIDTNIITELDALRECWVDGLQNAGEL